MKKVVLFVLLMVSCSISSFAQDIDPLAVGVFIAGKGGTNTSTAKLGLESGFAIAPLSDFGITGYIPVSRKKNMGVLVDVGMSSYSFVEDSTKNPTDVNKITHKFNYLTIGPSFTVSYITFGVNIGLPMGTSRKNGAGTEVSTIDNFTVLKGNITTIVPSDTKDNLEPIFEIKAGTMIPVVKTSLGRLNVFANAGYMMSRILKEEYFIQPNIKDTNPSVFSFSIGINFLFTISKPNNDEY
jgi:hypothetical protein